MGSVSMAPRVEADTQENTQGSPTVADAEKGEVEGEDEHKPTLSVPFTMGLLLVITVVR